MKTKKTSAPAGIEDDGARAERQRRRGLGGERVVPARAARLPHGAAAGNLSPNAPTQGYFHTQIYYDKRQKGSEAAANALAKLLRSLGRPPAAQGSEAASRSTPASMLMVVVGETFHDQLVTQPPPAPAPTHQAAERPLRSVGRARPAEAAREPGAVHARGADGARAELVPRHAVRRQAACGSTGSTRSTTRRPCGSSSRPAPASTGGSRRRTCRTRRSSPTRASSATIRGREFQLYYSGLEPAHGRAPRARQELLGREHAARLALERDDARDREGSQAAACGQVESGARWRG